jgi:hypothetical protein
MAPRSNLDHILTTIPPLIAESSFEICIYVEALLSSALLASVTQGQVSSTKAMLFYVYHARTGQGWHGPVFVIVIKTPIILQFALRVAKPRAADRLAGGWSPPKGVSLWPLNGSLITIHSASA